MTDSGDLEMEQLELFPGTHHIEEKPAHRFIPEEVIIASIELMGAIDLDPCSNSKTHPDVPAKLHYTLDDDALEKAWGPKKRRVFMNPPSRTTQRWINKLCQEYDAGTVSEAIIFLRAVVDSDWWQSLAPYPVCFLHRRLRLASHNRSQTFPLAVVYIGRNIQGFVEAFGEIGTIYIEFQKIEQLVKPAAQPQPQPEVAPQPKLNHKQRRQKQRQQRANVEEHGPMKTIHQGRYTMTVNHNACYVTVTNDHWNQHDGGDDQLRLQKAIQEIPGVMPSRYSNLSKGKDGSVRLIFSFRKGAEDNVVNRIESLLNGRHG
jgi:hypothetical protein